MIDLEFVDSLPDEGTPTSQASPVASSTPDHTTQVDGVRPRVNVGYDSPFLRRIPRSLVHVKGRTGVHTRPSVGYDSPFLRRIPKKFEHIKGRPGIRNTQSLKPHAIGAIFGAEVSPQPPKNICQELNDSTRMFEAEVLDEEVLGPAVEALGSAVEVLGTTMTFLGEAYGSMEQREQDEPDAEAEAENVADEKAGSLCSIS